MRIYIHFKNATVSAEILSSVRRRALFALGRYSQRIRAARIRLGNTNDSEGAVEQCCGVQVDLAGGAPIVVHERGISLQAAVDAAMERAERAVQRRIDVGRARQKAPVSTLVS